MARKLLLGDFELSFFSDGNYLLDGGAFFGIIPKALWQRKIAANPNNQVEAGLNSVLVRAGKQTVLIETGIGNKLGEKMKQIYRPQEKLLGELRAAGVRPEEIQIVINSHLHFDHCGWNTVMQGEEIVPTFPNARYYAPRGEWEVAQLQRERDAVSYISANYDPLVRSGQMQLLEKDCEIAPGVTLRNYPGHTRAMMAVLLSSGGQSACYISDLIPTMAHLDLTWGMGFDLFPLETIENKKRFYQEAIPQKWAALFTHDAQAPCARLELDERGRVRPVPAGCAGE